MTGLLGRAKAPKACFVWYVWCHAVEIVDRVAYASHASEGISKIVEGRTRRPMLEFRILGPIKITEGGAGA